MNSIQGSDHITLLSLSLKSNLARVFFFFNFFISLFIFCGVLWDSLEHGRRNHFNSSEQSNEAIPWQIFALFLWCFFFSIYQLKQNAIAYSFKRNQTFCQGLLAAGFADIRFNLKPRLHERFFARAGDAIFFRFCHVACAPGWLHLWQILATNWRPRESHTSRDLGTINRHSYFNFIG